MKLITLTAILSLLSVCLATSKKTSPNIFTDGLLPSKYSVVDGFFEQDDENTDAEGYNVIEENFGLKKGLKWSDLIEYINSKNEENFHRGESYKLMFLARHGEGYHNIARSANGYSLIDWRCYWQIRDGNEGMNWFDAELTETGIDQAQSLSRAWNDNINSKQNPAPLPQTFYVSPLRRTSQTFDYTWGPVTNYTENVSFAPTVKELARETYGIGKESRRHNKTFIESNWPNFKFEEGFTELDELWNPKTHESSQHRNYRSNLFLNDIFSNDANTIISLTSHSGFISSLLHTVHHRRFPLGTGQMIPVVIKASDPSSFSEPEMDDPWKNFDEQCKHYHSLTLDKLIEQKFFELQLEA